MISISPGINLYKLPRMGMNGKLRETVEASALWLLSQNFATICCWIFASKDYWYPRCWVLRHYVQLTYITY